MAMDLPGFGLSPEPDGVEVSIPQYARWVNGLSDSSASGGSS